MSDGTGDGSSDCIREGNDENSTDGPLDGKPVGWFVNCKVGDAEGTWDDKSDGEKEKETLGLSVGESDGAAEDIMGDAEEGSLLEISSENVGIKSCQHVFFD